MGPRDTVTENTVRPEENGTLLRFNEDGRLVLIESTLSQSKLLFFALLFTVLVVSSLWYWCESVWGHLQPFYEKTFRTPALVGPFLAPLVVLFVCAFVFPRQLIVDGEGIKYRKLGMVSQIAWEDVTDIIGRNLPSSVGMYGRPIRYEITIIVIGTQKKIALQAVFGVAQSALLTFLTAAWQRHEGRMRAPETYR